MSEVDSARSINRTFKSCRVKMTSSGTPRGLREIYAEFIDVYRHRLTP